MIKITYYGHSCFCAQIGNTRLLFDPFIRPNERAAHIDINSLEADFILLSHGHSDHVADALSIAENTGATIIANFEVANWFKETKGYEKVHPMNQGGWFKGDDFKLQYTFAIHSSSMPDGSYGGNPGGFVVSSKEHGSFYFAGDTALFADMNLIPLRTTLDFAILPIGDNFTMDAYDAATAAEFVKVKKVIGVHYDTFGYIEIDHNAAKETFKKQQKELILMDIGETRDFEHTASRRIGF